MDTVVAGGLGRPTALKEHEFDVRPLTLEDFEPSCVGPNALAFIERTKLALILARVLTLRMSPSDRAEDQVRIISSACSMSIFVCLSNV